jgi:hypothetical protein
MRHRRQAADRKSITTISRSIETSRLWVLEF